MYTEINQKFKKWIIPLTDFTAFVLASGFLYLLVWSLFDVTTGIGKQFSSIIIIFFFATFGGKLAGAVGFPPLTGMILVGFLFGNIRGVEKVYQLDNKIGAALRTLAFTFVLTLAGLGLDIQTIKKMALSIFFLSLTPCLVEGTTIMLTTHFIFKLPWLWALLMGFMVANVSLGVLVPGLLYLDEQGYGKDKGIMSFVVGTATIDNIIGITLFNVFFSTIFSTGSLPLVILSGPINILIGLAIGTILAVIMWFIPHKTAEHLVPLRVCMLIFTTLFILYGTRKLGYSGAGPLGCLTLSIVVAYRWKRETMYFDTTKYCLKLCWFAAQPLLFGTAGSQIVFSRIPINIAGKVVGILLLALLARMSAAFMVTARSNLNIRERLFIAIAWFPKASVQASIGALALDMVNATRDKQSPAEYDRNLEYGKMVLTVSVICIILTAPMGAILVQKFGSYLLTKSCTDDGECKNQLSTNL